MGNRKGRVWKLLDKYLKNRASEKKEEKDHPKKFFREKVNQN